MISPLTKMTSSALVPFVIYEFVSSFLPGRVLSQGHGFRKKNPKYVFFQSCAVCLILNPKQALLPGRRILNWELNWMTNNKGLFKDHHFGDLEKDCPIIWAMWNLVKLQWTHAVQSSITNKKVLVKILSSGLQEESCTIVIYNSKCTLQGQNSCEIYLNCN